MKRFLLIETLAIVIAFSIAACTSSGSSTSGGAAPASNPNTLTAVKVDATSLDGGAAYWAQSPKLDVSTSGAAPDKPAGPVVTLQAAYDGQYLVIRSEWPDTTNSLQQDAWTWDGKAFSQGGEGDLIAFIWPMSNNAAFASKGCAATCHNSNADQEKWWMGSDTADVRYDGWFWQSAATNPTGYSDDIGWTVLSDPADMGSPRVLDALDSGGHADNVNADATGPAFMSAKDLKSLILLDADKTAIDPTKLATGGIVPGFVLSKAVGSAGDVEAKGVWANGKWVVVQRRLLNTTHTDDASFTPPKPVPFGMAVADSAGDLDHKISKDPLTLDWK